MKVSLGVKQALVSGGVFAGLVFALASIDPRVQDRMSTLLAAEGSVSSFSGRMSQVAEVVGSAVKYQSIENAPLVIFATVGAVLVLFMVRT